jgi:hypothetical protein
MKKTEPGDRRENILAISMVSLWILTYFGARVLLKSYEMGTPLRVLVVLVPIIPFVIVLWMIIRGVRQMDELERRIQLEALAVAFPLTFLLLMTLGLLELAIKLNPQDWSYRHLWPFMFVFYLVGLMMARRRYQ